MTTLRAPDVCLIIVCSLLFLSTSQAQWVRTNSRFGNGSVVVSLACYGQNLFAGTMGSGVFLSTNSGTTWVQVNDGLMDLRVEALTVLGDSLYAGTADGGIFLSTNHGVTWVATNVGLSNTRVRALCTSDTILFAGTSGGVFVSSDRGSSWSSQSNEISELTIVTLACVDRTIFAGTYWESHPYQGGHVFYSLNGGKSWDLVSTGLPNAIVNDIAGMGKTTLVGMTSNYGDLFRSTDNGATWNYVPLIVGAVYSLYAFKGQTGNSYFVAGTSGYPPWGVYLSADSGITWSSVSSGLSMGNVRSFSVVGNTLFAGVDSSVWRRPLEEIITSVKQLSTELPNYFSLYQNYPNPFNPATIISYQLPLKIHITLEVYDLLGRKVETLVDKDESAGYKTVTFDASTLPSGIYFYRLEAGAYYETKKLLLLK